MSTTQTSNVNGATTSIARSNNHHTAVAKRGNEDGDVVGIVKMSLYWDEWSRCIGSTYQKDHLYRLGNLDSCSKQWKDVKLAAKAKFLEYRDPKQAQKILDSTYYKKRTTISPTAGAIWNLKEKPGWD